MTNRRTPAEQHFLHPIAKIAGRSEDSPTKPRQGSSSVHPDESRKGQRFWRTPSPREPAFQLTYISLTGCYFWRQLRGRSTSSLEPIGISGDNFQVSEHFSILATTEPQESLPTLLGCSGPTPFTELSKGRSPESNARGRTVARKHRTSIPAADSVDPSTSVFLWTSAFSFWRGFDQRAEERDGAWNGHAA
jgi:hypothetical protein